MKYNFRLTKKSMYGGEEFLIFGSPTGSVEAQTLEEAKEMVKESAMKAEIMLGASWISKTEIEVDGCWIEI